MNTWTVSELNRYIKHLFGQDEHLSQVQLVGEISNFKRHSSSGHCYFSIKDDGASVNCVMFRSKVDLLKFSPENGTEVLLLGSVSVYEKSGKYQVYVERMLPSGIGNLAAKFEALKKKLLAEGLFKSEPERRPCPKFPRKIGIVSSPTGAVIRDMLTVLHRRWPMSDVLLSPAIVQGLDGAKSIVMALEELYCRDDIDVIIVARGGGSQEDLWCFNEELVVRKIAQSPVPLISAVGHETDTTLADYAADMRAGTPSIAAEQAVPDSSVLADFIKDQMQAFNRSLENKFKGSQMQLKIRLKDRLFQDPLHLLQTYMVAADDRTMRLNDVSRRYLEKKQFDLEKKLEVFVALNPLEVLRRGFTVCHNADGKVIKQTNDLIKEQEISLTLLDGKAWAVVSKVEQTEGESI